MIFLTMKRLMMNLNDAMPLRGGLLRSQKIGHQGAHLNTPAAPDLAWAPSAIGGTINLSNQMF